MERMDCSIAQCIDGLRGTSREDVEVHAVRLLSEAEQAIGHYVSPLVRKSGEAVKSTRTGMHTS